ncbi:MAG TPA: epoxide hydrolase N-terminal domain-containing protein [Gemmatimonadales bacterium]|jgi:hypothetical protein
MTAEPFTIAIPQHMLDDLRDRLAQTRWIDAIDDAGWDYGTSLAAALEPIDTRR